MSATALAHFGQVGIVSESIPIFGNGINGQGPSLSFAATRGLLRAHCAAQSAASLMKRSDCNLFLLAAGTGLFPTSVA
jgi:hypothetical protein